MSWQKAEEADCTSPETCPDVETVIVPRSQDIGDFEVRRALPSIRRRMVGPFVFFDHFGPTVLAAGRGLDVRPHPHIGLSTLTWLIEGEIMHRDSIGSVQNIRPGEVNWMTAGRGIVHSERSPEGQRETDSPLLVLQTWLALPQIHEETEPDFQHVAAESLPVISGDGISATLVAGTGWGERSPVEVFSETIYADVRLDVGSVLPVPDEHEERALYIMSGDIEIAGDRFEPGVMLVLRPGDGVAVKALSPSNIMVIGGAAADGPRHVWWNFVSSSKERIEQAKEDWQAQRFGQVIGDDDEFIPLPEK